MRSFLSGFLLITTVSCVSIPEPSYTAFVDLPPPPVDECSLGAFFVRDWLLPMDMQEFRHDEFLITQNLKDREVQWETTQVRSTSEIIFQFRLLEPISPGLSGMLSEDTRFLGGNHKRRLKRMAAMEWILPDAQTSPVSLEIEVFLDEAPSHISLRLIPSNSVDVPTPLSSGFFCLES